jgi:hypothetical protein
VAAGVPAEYGEMPRMVTETIASGSGSRPLKKLVLRRKVVRCVCSAEMSSGGAAGVPEGARRDYGSRVLRFAWHRLGRQVPVTAAFKGILVMQSAQH